MTAHTVIDNAPSTGKHIASALGDQSFAVGEGSSEGWTVQVKKFGNIQAYDATSARFYNPSLNGPTTLIVETSANEIVEGQL